jgi:hypothetical protein
MPILCILCYNGSLVTWTVVSLTAAKCKHFILSMSGFAFSYTVNMFILMILYFCLSPEQFCHIIVRIWKIENHVQEHVPRRKHSSSVAIQLQPCKHACFRSNYVATAVVQLLISRSLPNNRFTYHIIILFTLISPVWSTSWSPKISCCMHATCPFTSSCFMSLAQ